MARKTIASSDEIGLRDLAGDAPVAHDEDPVAKADQLLHLGRDDDDRAALLGERRDEAVDLLLGADIDAAGRLVDDDDARLDQHHLGEQQLLLVAAGELAGEQIAAAGADVEILDGPVERRLLGRHVDERAAA